MGAEILKLELEQNMKEFEITTENIGTGFYYYKLFSDGSVLGNGKVLKIAD